MKMSLNSLFSWRPNYFIFIGYLKTGGGGGGLEGGFKYNSIHNNGFNGVIEDIVDPDQLALSEKLSI